MSLDTALKYVAREFSVDERDMRREFHNEADSLLDALLSSGYCMGKGGRVAVSEMGRRRLVDIDRCGSVAVEDAE